MQNDDKEIINVLQREDKKLFWNFSLIEMMNNKFLPVLNEYNRL